MVAATTITLTDNVEYTKPSTNSYNSSTPVKRNEHFYKQFSNIAAKFISELFNTHSHSLYRIQSFILNILQRTQIEPLVVLSSLVLLCRLKLMLPGVQGTCSERLFLASIILCCKTQSDRTYSNLSWCLVSKFNLMEVNKMERELFKYLMYNTIVNKKDLICILSYLNGLHLLIY